MKHTLTLALLCLTGSLCLTAAAQTGSRADQALTQLMEGNYVQAKNTATEVLNTDKINALAYAVRGGSSIFEEVLTAAQADLEKAVKLEPANGIYQALLADCYRIQNKTDLAKRTADKTLGLLRNPRTGMEYFARGLSYGTLEKWQEAISDYSKAIEQQPRYVRAYAKRAMIYYFTTKQPDLALADFTRCIQLNPKYSTPYFYTGTIYLNQRRYEQAIAELTKAVEYDPKYADAWFNRGVTYKNLQKYELAIADYKKTIELNPKDFEAFNNLGHVYFMQENYDQAMAEYNKAIALNPSFANSYLFRGNTYTRKKMPEQAWKDINKALELNPKYTDAYMERGHIYYNQKQYDQAMANYRKAVELSPHYSSAHLYVGFVHHDQQHFNDAITHYNKAIELDPNNMYAYTNRADAYESIGNSKQAIADRKKYADLGGKITATGSNTVKSIFPSGTFDRALAQKGLERGLSTIKGKACTRVDGRIFDAQGVKVVLFPVTPYLEEWYDLRDKKEGKKTYVYMSTEANQYRIETTADADGRFEFQGLKPGKYFIQIIHSFRQLKTARVYTGSDTYQNGPVRTTTNYYYDQDYTVDRSKRLEKFVEIKEDGDTKKITMANGLIKSCSL